MNCAIVLAIQSIADVVNSTIRDAVFESCPTKILLANPDAKGSKIGEFYRDFLQLNDRQVNLISRMTRKSEYYIISPKERRLFSLGLDPVALSFVGASGADDLARVRELKERYGRVWPIQWLTERDLPDWADAWHKVDLSFHSHIFSD